MIDKLGWDEYEVICDGEDCGEFLQVDGDFYDVLNEIKDHGWKSRKIRDEWQHFCPNCQ